MCVGRTLCKFHIGWNSPFVKICKCVPLIHYMFGNLRFITIFDNFLLSNKVSLWISGKHFKLRKYILSNTFTLNTKYCSVALSLLFSICTLSFISNREGTRLAQSQITCAILQRSNNTAFQSC